MNNSKNSKSRYPNNKYRFVVVIIIGLLLMFYLIKIGNKQASDVRSKSIVALPGLLADKIPTRNPNSSDPLISARYWALYDVESGSLVAGKNYDTKVAIASVTKIMTSIVVLDNSKVDEVVTVPDIAAKINGSTIQLRTSEKITVDNLLHGLLINSGNDAAYALAYYVGDKLDRSASPEQKVALFIGLMNDKASAIGLTKTNYFDPAGLDDNGKSTVRDQGILLSQALRSPIITSIINKPEALIKSTDGLIEHKLENSNRLVKEEMYYTGIIGGKTGFTPTAGHNLIAAASQDDNVLVAIIISTYSTLNTASATEAKKLLDWGFSSLSWT